MEPKSLVGSVSESDAEKYGRRTRFLRVAARVSLLVFGLGLIVFGSWSLEIAVFLGVGLLGSLVATFGFYLDYLIQLRIDGPSPNQFSVSDLMLTTAAIAGVLGLFNWIGWHVVWIVILVVIGMGGFLEDLNRIRETDLGNNKGGDEDLLSV